eukprot:scaffold2192_cov268-Chaetoceros_neogracile.AAC.54
MGNSSSSSPSACCISLDEISSSDENTLQMKSTPNAQNESSVKRKELWKIITSEERGALKSSISIPGGTDIEEGYSLSSISSKSSGSKGGTKDADDAQCKKSIDINGSYRDPHHYCNMDEMRNDDAECYHCASNEIRVCASSYDESAEAALVSYYQAERGINRRIGRLRSDDNRRE